LPQVERAAHRAVVWRSAAVKQPDFRSVFLKWTTHRTYCPWFFHGATDWSSWVVPGHGHCAARAAATSARHGIGKRVLTASGLAPHYSPHGLRHTYASIALQEGKDVYYICRMLGHASIQETVDTYARWLRQPIRGARLARPRPRSLLKGPPRDRFRDQQRTDHGMTALFRIPPAIVL